MEADDPLCGPKIRLISSDSYHIVPLNPAVVILLPVLLWLYDLAVGLMKSSIHLSCLSLLVLRELLSQFLMTLQVKPEINTQG